MPLRSYRFAILGGGPAGLAAAMELAEHGHAVTVYEKSARVGGLASGFPVRDQPGIFLEKFYHHLFRSDTDLIALIHRFGLQDRLIWNPDRSCVFRRGRAWPLRTPWDVIRCQPIGSFTDRLRFACASYKLHTARDWQDLDLITCSEFYRRAGAEVGYRNFWAPLLSLKFGCRGEQASAAFLWGRIQARKGEGFRGRRGLGYLRGGLQQLFDRLAHDLAERCGCHLRVGKAVQAIWRGDSGKVGIRTADQLAEFDGIISTIPVATLAGLLQDADADELATMRSVEYMAALCMILRLKDCLSDYYWTNVIDPTPSMGVIVEHTNLVPSEDYGGTHIVYVANYLPQDHPWLREKSDTIFALYSDALARMYRQWDPGSVLEIHVIRAHYATPVYPRGHGGVATRLGQLRPLGRIWLADMSQIYPEDRNVSHAIRLGRRVARRALAQVQQAVL